ncbi:MAG: hypothetical protein RIQ60_3870 [Pseudomonadota bacterium]
MLRDWTAAHEFGRYTAHSVTVQRIGYLGDEPVRQLRPAMLDTAQALRAIL